MRLINIPYIWAQSLSRRHFNIFTKTKRWKKLNISNAKPRWCRENEALIVGNESWANNGHNLSLKRAWIPLKSSLRNIQSSHCVHILRTVCFFTSESWSFHPETEIPPEAAGVLCWFQKHNCVFLFLIMHASLLQQEFLHSCLTPIRPTVCICDANKTRANVPFRHVILFVQVYRDRCRGME